MKKDQVIALDGPAGSGKSSVAKELAKRLGVVYINTGALYRSIAWYCLDQQVDWQNEAALEQALQTLKLDYAPNDQVLVAVNGQDVSQAILQHEISELTSKLSGLPSIRRYLLGFQRDLAQQRSCVMEGRDIGTVVFPQAMLKIFLTASVEARALRRLKQLKQQGETVDLAELKQDIAERDERDKNRPISPLKQADDAHLIDSSGLSFEEVVVQVVALARQEKIPE